MFVDDNLIQDRKYIIELLKALAPLNKKWVTQATIEISEDEESEVFEGRAGSKRPKAGNC